MAAIAKPRRRGTCPVCAHKERAIIEEALVSGMSGRRIARMTDNLSRRQLKNHLFFCRTLEELARAGEEKRTPVNGQMPRN